MAPLHRTELVVARFVDSRSNRDHDAAIARTVEMRADAANGNRALRGRPGGERLHRPEGDPVSISSDHPTTQPAALDGCVQPGSADLIDVGGGSQAAVLGTGPVGVVLSNQSDQNLCGWLPFAKTLAAHGFRVLVYDYSTAVDPAGDVVNAAAKLRALGVRTVLLAGVSRGANASLIAAPGITPPVAAVVSLSAERAMLGQDVLPFVAKLKAPVLFITAKGDRYGAVDATPQHFKAATKASSRRLEVVAGDAHGTALLTGPNGAKVQAMIIDFLSKHAQAP